MERNYVRMHVKKTMFAFLKEDTLNTLNVQGKGRRREICWTNLMILCLKQIVQIYNPLLHSHNLLEKVSIYIYGTHGRQPSISTTRSYECVARESWFIVLRGCSIWAIRGRPIYQPVHTIFFWMKLNKLTYIGSLCKMF